MQDALAVQVRQAVEIWCRNDLIVGSSNLPCLRRQLPTDPPGTYSRKMLRNVVVLLEAEVRHDVRVVQILERLDLGLECRDDALLARVLAVARRTRQLDLLDRAIISPVVALSARYTRPYVPLPIRSPLTHLNTAWAATCRTAATRPTSPTPASPAPARRHLHHTHACPTAWCCADAPIRCSLGVLLGARLPARSKNRLRSCATRRIERLSRLR